MKQLKLWLLILISLVCFGVQSPVSAQAKSTPRVLLVYDSQNVAANGQNKIAAVQRILTAAQVRVTTVAVADYQAGMLTKYEGLITMINWPQTAIDNGAFKRDRQNFKGTRLHIGQNLTATEAAAIGGQRVKLYHQQLTLQNQAATVHQLLSFSETMTTLTKLPAKARTFGRLKAQSVDQRLYPYGTVVGNQGYLPYFSTGGYSFILAAQLIGQLFGQTGHYQPLLTITKVTPYSNLTVLNQLTKRLYQAGIPFAISTTTVGDNAHFKAYQRFVKVLRLAENRGGVIFLKTPVVGGVTASSGPGLDQLMNNYLIQFAQSQVFPVGISTSAYWNQDRVYRENALAKANQILWLPNPATPVYAKQDNQARTFDHSIYGLAATSLSTVKQGSDLGKLAIDFPIPTAVTMTMPNSQRGLHDLMRRLKRLNYQWFNPALAQTKAEITSGTVSFGYQQGTYFLNGHATRINTSATKLKTLAKVKPEEIWVNRFFKTQGKFLLIFFLLAFAVFVGFILLGRRVYLNMFKNKSGGKSK